MRTKKTAIAITIAVLTVMVFGSVTASASSTVLKKESRGSKVTALQKDLIRLGYLSEEATGYFGSATEEAVKKVQKEYGYEPDGIAGSVTLSLIDRLRGRTGSSSGKAGTATTKKTTAASTPLKEGDENSSVKNLQKALIQFGYLNTNATGYFGPATTSAVKRLQKDFGYTADGIAGKATMALLDKLENETKTIAAAKPEGTEVKAEVKAAAMSKDPAEPDTGEAAANSEKTDEAAIAVNAEGGENSGETVSQTDFLLKWYGDVEKKFPNGDKATVYDIKTGLSFDIMRTYGHNHADCETLTPEDTAIMKKIYSGKWSWERRAVIVSVGDLKIAACMTGYPHAGLDKYAANKTVSSRSGGYGRGTNLDKVKGNNMNGVFDIHFLGSKNHYNNKVDAKHQALVKEAAKWATENYK